MEKCYRISESMLRELLFESLKLNALEAGGVDNWPGYYDAIVDFMKENGTSETLTLYDIVDNDLMKDFVDNEIT